MKKTIAVLAFSFSVLCLSAQQNMHTIKVLKDDPGHISDRIIGLNISHAQFSKYEQLKAGFGVDVVWGINAGMQFQGSAMYYYLCVRNADGPDFATEGGIAYLIGSHSKTKELKVILKYSETKTQTSNGTLTTSTVHYLKQDGTCLSKTALRAGVYTKRAGMDESDALGAPIVNYVGTGVYGGIEFSKQACLISEVDGEKGMTSGYTRVYFDGIFLPVSKYTTSGVTETPGKIGFRGGFVAYYNPNKRVQPEYGKLKNYQVYPSLFFKSEAGVRGGEGWFFNLGLGCMIYRNK